MNNLIPSEPKRCHSPPPNFFGAAQSADGDNLIPVLEACRQDGRAMGSVTFNHSQRRILLSARNWRKLRRTIIKISDIANQTAQKEY